MVQASEGTWMSMRLYRFYASRWCKAVILGLCICLDHWHPRAHMSTLLRSWLKVKLHHADLGSRWLCQGLCLVLAYENQTTFAVRLQYIWPLALACWKDFFPAVWWDSFGYHLGGLTKDLPGHNLSSGCLWWLAPSSGYFHTMSGSCWSFYMLWERRDFHRMCVYWSSMG